MKQKFYAFIYLHINTNPRSSDEPKLLYNLNYRLISRSKENNLEMEYRICIAQLPRG